LIRLRTLLNDFACPAMTLPNPRDDRDYSDPVDDRKCSQLRASVISTTQERDRSPAASAGT